MTRSRVETGTRQPPDCDPLSVMPHGVKICPLSIGRSLGSDLQLPAKERYFRLGRSGRSAKRPSSDIRGIFYAPRKLTSVSSKPQANPSNQDEVLEGWPSVDRPLATLCGLSRESRLIWRTSSRLPALMNRLTLPIVNSPRITRWKQSVTPYWQTDEDPVLAIAALLRQPLFFSIAGL